MKREIKKSQRHYLWSILYAGNKKITYSNPPLSSISLSLSLSLCVTTTLKIKENNPCNNVFWRNQQSTESNTAITLTLFQQKRVKKLARREGYFKRRKQLKTRTVQKQTYTQSHIYNKSRGGRRHDDPK